MRKKRKLSVRLISTVSFALMAIFLLIFFTFNFVFTRYIETTAATSLNESRLAYLARPLEETGTQEESGSVIRTDPAVTDKHRPFESNVEQLIIDQDYQLQTTFQPDNPFQDDSKYEDFVAALASEQISLSDTASGSIEWEDSLYYYTMAETTEEEGQYAVFYINMTDLYRLEQNLNIILLVVMGAGLLLVVFSLYLIVYRITRPLQTLAYFAGKMGNGEYIAIEDDFVDQELHELKTTMNETMTKLKNYDEKQRNFFQNASHELRTPLQIIQSNAEGVSVGIIEPQTAAKKILHETDNLGHLVEDILYLSRLESRSADRIIAEYDLRETLSYTAERYSSLFKQNNIQLQFDFQEDPVVFHYDERDMERAFQNLLSNASRYARSKVVLQCRIVESRIMISIFNDGEPIAKEELPHVFDRFYKGKKGNHGIGLSIVKSIVQNYKGRVEATSSPKGTQFTIFFPLPQPSSS